MRIVPLRVEGGTRNVPQSPRRQLLATTAAATDAVVMTTTTTPAAVTSVRPLYGPVAGGTRVNITTGPAVNATSVLAVHFGRHTVSPLRSREFHQFTLI